MMFVALDDQGLRVHAWDAGRDQRCVCPECQAAVVLKRGRIVVPHFAHHAGVGCAYGTGESERHHEMKWQIGSMFAGQPVRYEVPFAPERRADLVVGACVIECQCSPLSVDEWESRTVSYNTAGFSVLWIWDEDRLHTIDGEEYRIPAEIRHCHQKSYGTVYILSGDGELVAAHFSPVVRTSYSEYDGIDYDRTLKTIKYVDRLSIDDRRGWVERGPDGHKLVSFIRGGWWKA